MIKQKKDAGICGNVKEKATREKITPRVEEIKQKVLAKERRLKRYRQRVKQYRQDRIFQNNERKFYQRLGGHDTKHTNNRMPKNPNDLGLKYGNQKNIIKRLNG